MRDTMKILAIHNFHRKGSASGDDQVFKSESALLEKHGHTVIRYTVNNDEFDNVNLLEGENIFDEVNLSEGEK